MNQTVIDELLQDSAKPAGFYDAANPLIDELADLTELWATNRANGITREGCRAGIVHLCAAIAESAKPRRKTKTQN
jgi:hypothetical protein